ncbi:hypothetical protein EDF87_11335 [Pseudomonas helmanticensis]|uniref:Uncharacterized protein n=1 Tax=Pseudomonas helmanticensis TaxID=1471381 RepID=A0A4R7V0Y5_9PSED|nr:hypothetical protein [Pseudomonas helmanticensis]TDV42909.1 hypothetical protein EDF87_11335 [Pseudomonas helmanticensis]
MSLPNHLIQAVRDNPLEAATAVCRYALSVIGQQSEWTQDDHSTLLEATALILSLQEQFLIPHTKEAPDLDGSMGFVCNRMRTFLTEVQDELIGQSSTQKLESIKSRFSITLANGFGYEFTDGDLKRIRTLIKELRELIVANQELDEDHKQRLLKRLEKMQAEIHKKMSDLNSFYGLLVEASIVLKKVGENAKPIVDRIKELTKISWGTQARAENLPSGSEPPMIGNDPEPPALD